MHLSSRAASGRVTTLAQVGTHSESCYVLVVTLGKFQEHGAGWDRMLSRALIFSQQSWQGKAEPGQVHIFLCFTGTLSHIRDCTGRWAGCLRGKVSRVDWVAAWFSPTFHSEHFGQNLPWSWRVCKGVSKLGESFPPPDHMSQLCGQVHLLGFPTPSEPGRLESSLIQTQYLAAPGVSGLQALPSSP